MNFWSSLFSEIGARRRRLRASIGDRGQGLFEFLMLGGLSLGSLGLLVLPWMPSAAPWGFALPFAFPIGYLYLDLRRQRAMAQAGGDEDALERAQSGSDRLALFWSLGCAAAGAAAFFIALNSKPPPAPEDAGWQPPADVVTIDLDPQ